MGFLSAHTEDGLAGPHSLKRKERKKEDMVIIWSLLSNDVSSCQTSCDFERDLFGVGL